MIDGANQGKELRMMLAKRDPENVFLVTTPKTVERLAKKVADRGEGVAYLAIDGTDRDWIYTGVSIAIVSEEDFDKAADGVMREHFKRQDKKRRNGL
jgi:hypothetical protein